MASSHVQTIPAEILAKWEKLYNLLGKGYAHIANHPDTETEIRTLFLSMDTTFLEGTSLEKEYRIFPTIFTNFLEVYRRVELEVTMASVVRARFQDQSECLVLANFMADNHKRAIEYANEQVSILVRERANLVERLALSQTLYERDQRNVLLRFQCSWLEERLDDLTLDIACERSLVRDLEVDTEHHEAKIARLKEKCNHLLFRLTELDSQSVQCRQNLNNIESELSSFVMLIRTQFGFTLPPQ